MTDDFDSQFDDDFEDENPVDDSDDDFEEDFDDDEFGDDDFQQEDEGFEEDDDFEQEDDSYDDSDDSGDDNDYDKPVDEGDVVEVEIDDLGSKGDGIARVDGFVIFVPGGEVGETYDVEVTSVGRKFAFAEIPE